jgi:hypothetical protein
MWKDQAVWGWSSSFLADGLQLVLDSVDHMGVDVDMQ